MTSRKYFCSLLSNKLTFLSGRPPAKAVNFLSKDKQIFDIYNFKKALKRVILIRKIISSCFAGYGIIFLARKSNNRLFVELLCFCLHYYHRIMIIIIHCSIFSHSHWLRAYDEFFVFCWWREHMTNNYRICHVLTPSETNTRFICHVLTPSELFAVICYVCLSV